MAGGEICVVCRLLGFAGLLLGVMGLISRYLRLPSFMGYGYVRYLFGLAGLLYMAREPKECIDNTLCRPHLLYMQ
jgi:hypothetical protein